MLDGSEQDFAQRWKESMLEGNTPQEFIHKQVDRLINSFAGEKTIKIGNGDIAYIIQFWINQGIVTIEDITDHNFLQSLGLSPEEAQVFVPETLPEMQKLMKEKELKEFEEEEVRNREYASQFVNSWGLERLDEIGNFYLRNPKKLDKTDRYWQNNIKRYKNQRAKLENEFKEISDPFQKAQFLMKQAYYLTYLHPSELQQIFEAERDTSTHPYLNSLLDTSTALFQNATGKDPDFNNVHISSGGISMTVSMFRADDLESMKRLKREQTMEALIFGAKNTNEITGPFKNKIYPLAKRGLERTMTNK